jgi:glutamine---fructose-6-phosphate transaminase (isomerizing)
LKLVEAAGVPAIAHSSLEALHGHLAALDGNVAVVLIATGGPLLEDLALVALTAHSYGARVVAVGDASEQLPAGLHLDVPPVPESLAPLLTAIAGQLLSCQLARLRRTDAANPPGLEKLVTARPSYLDAEVLTRSG